MIKESEWLDSADEIVNHYSTRPAAKEHLEYLIYTHALCKKINDNAIDGAPCYSFQLGQCHGACIGKEDINSYNERFELAYHEVNKIYKDSFYIISEGRTHDENALLIVENGFCNYLGYLSKDQNYSTIEEMKEELLVYHGNVETNRMIEYYLAKSKDYKKVLLR